MVVIKRVPEAMRFLLNLFRSRKHQAEGILQQRRALESLSERQIGQQIRKLHWKIRTEGARRNDLPEAYALIAETSRRVLGLTHFPVQIMGGIVLFEGDVAEMQTGEGKTLTATLPVAFRAFAGHGVHVMTSNDYLARRDASVMRPLYEALGLTVGCIQPQMPDEERRAAYACDITYGTAQEIGFDFLRDRLKRGAGVGHGPERLIFKQEDSAQTSVQRGCHFALIDEADSILIDEARTPLIIGVMKKDRPAMICLYRWCAAIVEQLHPGQDFLYDVRRKQADLTDKGCQRINLLHKPVLLDGVDVETIYQNVENALVSRLAHQRDKSYVVHDGEIAIVNESTGRKMEGRKWQAGLHQAIEAKEGVEITELTGSAAKITIQSLFRHYQHLAGMSGTAIQSRAEFRRVYRLRVRIIPTHRPCLRKLAPPRLFLTREQKHAEIIREVQRLIRLQRCLLIGTPSVEASESLARSFKEAGIVHTLLNAHASEQEAEIISRAGRAGAVTIATNMAGRGTDILLDDVARASGGLHVIATQLHSSKRIDRQLVGRSARQGDPGSAQFFLCLEDELLRIASPQKLGRLLSSGRPDARGELGSSWIRLFDRIQRSLERLHEKQRKQLLRIERDQQQKYLRIGLDPYLEQPDE